MERNFNLLKLQNKAGAGIDSKISYLIGALVLIVLIVALAPDMFSNLALMNTTSEGGNTPNWVPTTLVVIVGAGLIFLVWNAIGGSK